TSDRKTKRLDAGMRLAAWAGGRFRGAPDREVHFDGRILRSGVPCTPTCRAILDAVRALFQPARRRGPLHRLPPAPRRTAVFGGKSAAGGARRVCAALSRRQQN